MSLQRLGFQEEGRLRERWIVAGEVSDSGRNLIKGLSLALPPLLVVLAGILQTQFAKVERAYRQAGLRLLATEVEKEWQSGAFVRTRK